MRRGLCRVVADRPVLGMLLLALAYALTASSDLFFALPQAAASPIWPAAGVALACLIVGGLRLWPGVLLGYLLYDPAKYALDETLARDLAEAVVFAIGPALQAVVGAWFVRRRRRGLGPTVERTIMVTTFLAGPVASLVGATWGVGALWLLGYIESGSSLSTWFIWWFGDTLGILLFAPLVLLLLPGGERVWPDRSLRSALPLVGAAAILIPSVYWFHHAEEADVRQPLQLQAERAYDLMNERLRSAAMSVIATGSYFATARDVSAREFEEFGARLTSDDLLGLSWVPRVPREEVDGFVARARASGLEDYAIVEPDGEFDYRPAAERDEYFPLLHVLVPTGRTRPYGFDVGAEPVRAATMARARDTGLPAASEPKGLLTSGQQAIVLFVPIYNGLADPDGMSVEQRRRDLEGFIGGVIDPESVAAALGAANAAAGLSFRITDVSDGDRHQEVISLGAAGGASLMSRTLDVYGRSWQIDAATPPGYWLAGASGKSQVFLLAVLLGGFLMSVQTVATATRNRSVRLKVLAHTRELAENRRRLDAALNIAHIACWELDLRRQQLTLDDRSLALLGTSAKHEGGNVMRPEEWVAEFVYPEDGPEVVDALTRTAEQSPDASNAPREFRVIRRDGEIRHLLMHFDADIGADGLATRILGSTQDITDRKTMEIALRESEEYSRSILESSRDCIKVLSLDGRFLDVNSAGCGLLGIDDVEEVRGSDWRSYWSKPDDYASACKALETAAAGGTARFTARSETIPGDARWWDVVMSPILDSAGRPRSLLCVTRDITAEREAQAEIRRMNESLEEEILRRNAELVFSERELRGIFDVAAVGIAHVDRDNRVMRVNPKLCEIAGFSREDFMAEDHYARTHPEDRPHEQEQIAKLMGGEIDSYEIEKRYLRPDQRTIWVRVNGSVVRDDDGKPVYRVAVVTDISEAKAASEARVASERRYRELFEKNPMPMYTYDLETLEITSVNDAAVRHYGYSRWEFLGMTLRDIRPEDQYGVLDRRLEQHGRGYRPPLEVVHRKKDGTRIIVAVSSHDVSDEGRPSRVVLAHDITEQKRAAVLLEGQKAALERITAGAALDESLVALAKLVEAWSPGVRCAVLVADDAARLHTVAAPGLSREFVAAIDGAAGDEGMFADLARRGDALLVENIAAESRWNGFRGAAAQEGIRACWSTPIFDAAENVQGIFVLFYDEERRPTQAEGETLDTLTRTAAIAITKDRETRRLMQSEERFRTTFENAALGMLHLGTDGRFVRANPSITKIIGYSEEELRQHTADTLSHPDDIELGREQRTKLFSGEIPSYSVEKRYVRKDGRTVWLSVTISTVRDKDGRVDYAIALAEDITWRKEAEAQLHQQQEITRLLLENLTEGVIACDAEGQLMLFNKAAREWHGADPREIPSAQWSDYYDLYQSDGETPLPMDQIPLMRAFHGERVKNVEMSIVRKGHPARIVLASGAPLLDAEGRKRGAVVVMHDVTMRRQSLQKLERATEELKAANAAVEHERASLARRVAERTAELTATNDELAAAKEAAEAASRAKSAFLAVMSHEIRTPMNGILGMVDVLSQSSLSDDQQDAVHTIRDSSFSLLRLIDDILDFSKVEAGRLELERTALSLPEAVENVCDSLTPEALSNDVDLRLFVDPAVPQNVMGDPTRLRQLLFNLVGNAIKFSSGREGMRGQVRVRVERDHESAHGVCFRIVDNGVGIAPEVLPTLFESFTQAEVSTTRRFGGTGLGLAITKRLVELMDGVIDVNSEPGRGSEFTVTLPLEAAETHALVAEFELHGLRTVLVDSQGYDTRALAAYLEDAGASVDIVSGRDDLSAGSAHDGEPAVIVQHVPEHDASDARLITACIEHDRHVNVLVTPGPRSGARIIAPHIVLLQASAIRRRDFLAAVAVAAGRASPQIARPQAGDLVRGQLVAPTVSQARRDGRLILVAEDDPINQKVILRQLALLGYAGELAANGADALSMWRAGEYALLLTDLHMPEVDGYELARTIRAEEPDGTHMPILALTANALRGEAERAQEAGFDAYLTKPLQLSVLGDRLAEWIPEVGRDDDQEPPREPRGASAGTRAIDLDVLRDIIGDDETLLRELLSDYLESAPQQLDELREALADGDTERLIKRAHRQKGAARAIGAARLGDLCAELENAARAADEALIRQLAAELDRQAAAVEAGIRDLVAAGSQNTVANDGRARGTVA